MERGAFRLTDLQAVTVTDFWKECHRLLEVGDCHRRLEAVDCQRRLTPTNMLLTVNDAFTAWPECQAFHGTAICQKQSRIDVPRNGDPAESGPWLWSVQQSDGRQQVRCKPCAVDAIRA
jgi:hypothetical protein